MIILHRELWEGLKAITLLIIWILGIPDIIYFTYFNAKHSSNVSYKKLNLTIKTYRKECIRGLHTYNRGPFRWVYDITKLSDNLDCLIEGAPFKTKTECAEILNTTRKSVTVYLDSNKILNNKWIISSIELSKEQLSNFLIPLTVWEVVTGELLGDGYISYDPIRKPLTNARLEFTFAAKILHYVNYLKFNVLAPLCTSSKPTPWSKSKLEDQEPTQYWFSTKRLPVLTSLHSVWYKEIEGKFIKILPHNIEELLTPIACKIK